MTGEEATGSREVDPTAASPSAADPTGGDGLLVGELARATGLTVRTLHHYESIGLLAPVSRSGSGYRIYRRPDVERLYQVRALRQLGLSLADIQHTLAEPDDDLAETLDAQLARVDRQLADLHSQRRALTAATRTPTLTNLIDLLEAMTMPNGTVERNISILVYADIAAAYDHLTEVFGLGPGHLIRDDDGTAVHAELAAGNGTVWLHPESDDHSLGSPRRAGLATAMLAVMVDDVDEHHRRAVEQGADIAYPPVDQPYGYREYSARDPEGGLWSFMRPLD